jgi:hypothetical protein
MSFLNELKFKHIEFDDLEKYSQYYNNLNNRFYKSFMYLTQSKKFIYTFYKKALLIFKRGHIMNNKYVYLLVPPITKNNDRKLELEIINDLALIGVKTKLTIDDVIIYGLDIDNLMIDKGNDEFIYSAKKICLMKGKKWGRVRTYINKNNQLVENGQLRVETTRRVDPLTMRRLIKITDYWIKHHKNMKGIKYYLNNLNNFKPAYITYVENSNNDILAYMIVENYGNELILTMPVKNYKINWKYDINAFVMNKVAEYWLNYYIFTYDKLDVQMNIGASVNDKGLHKNKNKYEPIIIQQIYNNKVDTTLINDIYLDINIL